MGDRCEVHLERYNFMPGETVNGKVDCFFSQQQTVRNIRVRFKGRAKVYWKQGKTQHRADELYFNEETNLLLCETKFNPGSYTYPFNFTLPDNIPSTIRTTEKYVTANVLYKVKATVDKQWAVDYTDKKEFTVNRIINLNFMRQLQESYVYTTEKAVSSVLSTDGAINVWVQLLKRGFVPGEMVTFKACVKNASNLQVKEVRFRIVHGFQLITKHTSRVINADSGQHFGIINSDIAPQSEKTWDLELRLFPNAYCFNAETCRIIQPFCELKGEICLPLLHKNFKFKIPLVVGTVPFA